MGMQLRMRRGNGVFMSKLYDLFEKKPLPLADFMVSCENDEGLHSCKFLWNLYVRYVEET